MISRTAQLWSTFFTFLLEPRWTPDQRVTLQNFRQLRTIGKREMTSAQ